MLATSFVLSLPLALGSYVVSVQASTRGNLLLQRGRSHLSLGSPSYKGSETQSLKHLYPWYHTSAEIHAEAKRLEGDCGGALSLRSIAQDGVSIDVATVRANGTNPTNKVFIIFGEHSRELISPESGLYFLKVLCGRAAGDSAKKGAAETLKDSEFQLVLNGNPRSRRAVESGSFCTRTNPDGVDLNRNWDDKWKAEGVDTTYQNPGPYPFSEPETRIFRQLVTEYRPTTFLTVHSGTRGMYMPWAYDREHMASRNKGAMLQVLRDLDKDHCQCPFGAAGKEVGYSCPGTCLDWAYDKLSTPYSFAFEIYTSPDMDESLKSRWQEKLASGGASLLEQGEHLAHSHFLDLFQKHGSDFVQSRDSAGAGRFQQESCFFQFNPDTYERFNATLRNWAGAYLDMSNLIVEDMRKASAGDAQNFASATV